jgi:hypothetical protein
VSSSVEPCFGCTNNVREKCQPYRAVALQVAFERQTLKPVFSLDRL